MNDIRLIIRGGRAKNAAVKIEEMSEKLFGCKTYSIQHVITDKNDEIAFPSSEVLDWCTVIGGAAAILDIADRFGVISKLNAFIKEIRNIATTDGVKVYADFQKNPLIDFDSIKPDKIIDSITNKNT